MSHTSDYLNVDLRCPVSGNESNTLIKLDLRHVELGDTLEIGDALIVDWPYLDPAGYYRLRKPAKGEAYRIGADYDCRACAGEAHWAEVVVADGRIVSVDVVTLDLDDINRVHAIDDSLNDMYKRRLSVNLTTMSDEDRLAYLRAHPPAKLMNLPAQSPDTAR